MITGRKVESLETAASSLRAKNIQVVPLVCHQGDPEAIDKLFEQLDKRGVRLENAVLNAATDPTFVTFRD